MWGRSPWRDFASDIRAHFAPGGLEPEIIEVFEGLSFKKLYEFQESAIKEICSDRHALIVAPTGRGKTESWIIPILQYIIAQKRGRIDGHMEGPFTKALLIYPLKALAQDQLKRLIDYLFRLNLKLSAFEKVTVGIFDGDTPYSKSDRDTFSYLSTAFRFFTCPIYDKGTERCQKCSRSLIVNEYEGRYIVSVPDYSCRENAPLDFIHLTRQDILSLKSDIILTNPDTLNWRLFNINSYEEKELLIGNPKFIVLDEVHTYTGTFGSHVAMLIRRLKQVRREIAASGPKLRFIASSATVDNKEELFTKLCAIPKGNFSLVEERGFRVPEPPKTPLTMGLESFIIEEGQFYGGLSGDTSASPEYIGIYKDLGLKFPVGGVEIEEWASGHIFNSFCDLGCKSEVIMLLREFYLEQSKNPKTFGELVDIYLKKYSLGVHEAGNLVRNLFTLGDIAGILERRAHLFAWPIDGFYTCLKCGKIYSQPMAYCECGYNFVTKISLCSYCGEEVLESWLCPSCLEIQPLASSVDGEVTYMSPPSCSCGGNHNTCIRVVWNKDIAFPGGEVPEPILRTGGGGRHLEVPKLKFPWICGSCGHVQTAGTASPDRCINCGSKVLALAGIFDISWGEECEICGAQYISGRHREHNTAQVPLQLETFSVIDSTWRIRRVSEIRAANPCYHPRRAASKKGMFDSLMRSPEHIYVTSAQFLMRKLFATEGAADLRQGLRAAKSLSFSDSQNEMQRISRSFREPEEQNFIQQVILHELKASGEITLEELIRRVARHIDGLDSLLRKSEPNKGDGQTPGPDFSYRRYFEEKVQEGRLRGIIRSNVLPGRESELLKFGLIDVGLKSAGLGLSADEKAILARLLGPHPVRRTELSNIKGVGDHTKALDSLLKKHMVRLTRDKESVVIDDSQITVNIVGPENPLLQEQTGEYVFKYKIHLAKEDVDISNLVPFAVSLEERANISSKHFCQRAFVLAYSPPIMLMSRTYSGRTPAGERRKIEYQFKYGYSPNFLSSGPAMEVGVDIGDLNTLMLYGTPPNINSYLQRIGRAGRRAKKSLIMSVSKRNPIDYYYYHAPMSLINSRPEPVPLAEHNREVMKVSLTWALLDFISCKFWVKWIQRTSVDGRVLACDGREAIEPGTPRPQGILNLAHVISLSNEELRGGQLLRVISDIIKSECPIEAKKWLCDILGYSVCDRCGSYNDYGVTGSCNSPGCKGSVISAEKLFSDVIDNVIAEFEDHLIKVYWNFRRQADRQKDQLFGEINEIRKEIRELEDDWDADVSKLDNLRSRERLLEQRYNNIINNVEEAAKQSFIQFLEASAESKYAFNMRGVGDSVTVVLYKDKGDSSATQAFSRDVGMAVREFHPYAINLNEVGDHIGRYVCCKVEYDGKKTDELAPKLGLGICPRCLNIQDINIETCARCGQIIRRLEVKVPVRAEAYSTDYIFYEQAREGGRPFTAGHVYRWSNRYDVERTFPFEHGRVDAFKPEGQFKIIGQHGQEIGQLDYGKISIISYVPYFVTSYQGNIWEPQPTPIEVCRDEGCLSVIDLRAKNLCVADIQHNVSELTTRFVCPGYMFETMGLRLRLGGNVATHSFAHTIRKSLQKIGGVGIREIGELMDTQSGIAYIYDGDSGGSGLTELLISPGRSGQYDNFQEACIISIVTAQSCKCEGGCPMCLFQYGCSLQNQLSTLDRKTLLQILQGGAMLEKI